MKRLSDLEYLKLNRFKKFLHKIVDFLIAIPMFFVHIGVKCWHIIKAIGVGIKNIAVTIVRTFIKGSWKSKVSYFIMGFGNLTRKQFLRGFLLLAFQTIFILYMVLYGGYWLGKFDNLGDLGRAEVYDPILDTYKVVYNDDSFKILLYGTLTIFFIVAFAYTWYTNVKQCSVLDEIEMSGKKVKSGKDDLRSLVDDQFHKTLLSLPLAGILFFTVLPMIFMILVAFTNYDANHDGLVNLFTWVGLDNFNDLIYGSEGTNATSLAFGEILSWTLIWAFFATFTNYFLGMFVAMMINKKGIKFKKVWRTILVLTIAVPQFISLLYISKLFADNGLVNGLLLKLREWDNNHDFFITWLDNAINLGIGERIQFWGEKNLARVMVIIINIWIGIPYLMLIATGVLMNIPSDLYESSKIDGANAFQQYTKITLPYMLFVTGPYLLTSFIGNINNFNVIYLLTAGGPINPDFTTSSGTVGHTDLLITWLFKIAMGAESNYKLASVVGIMIFVVVAVLSLIVYNVMPSTKNEEDFA